MVLGEIVHIHRDLKCQGIILGVDNIEQIANVNFRTDSRILKTFVKPSVNQRFGYENDKKAIRVLSNTGVLCIYGASLGATDTFWCTQIGEWMKTGTSKRILYFHHDHSESFLQKVNMLEQMRVLEEDSIKEDLCKRFGLNPQTYESRIDVVINSSLFNGRK